MSSSVEIASRSFNKLERYLRIGFRLLCWSLGLLYLYGIMYLVFTPDEGNHEDKRSEWCEEYHPNLSFNDCADIAGW